MGSSLRKRAKEKGSGGSKSQDLQLAFLPENPHPTNGSTASLPVLAGHKANQDCRACLREQFLAQGHSQLRGRPPKHTYGLTAQVSVVLALADHIGLADATSALEVFDSADAARAAEACRPRVCFSHRYVGRPWSDLTPVATPLRKRSFTGCCDGEPSHEFESCTKIQKPVLAADKSATEHVPRAHCAN